MSLDNASAQGYAIPNLTAQAVGLPSLTAGGGFSSSGKGAKAMRHGLAHGFFNALRFFSGQGILDNSIMVDGVWEAARLAGSVTRSVNLNVIHRPRFDRLGRWFKTIEKEPRS